VPPHKADQSLDLAFIITLAGAAELVLKQAQSKDPRPVDQYLGPNSTFGASLVLSDRVDCGTPTKYAKASTCPLFHFGAKCLGNLARIGLEERRIAVWQVHAEIVMAHLLAINDRIGPQKRLGPKSTCACPGLWLSGTNTSRVRRF